MIRSQGDALRLAQFIDSHTRVKGYAPNFREMREHFGFSGNASVQNLLRHLEAIGIVRRPRQIGGKRPDRSIRIVPAARHAQAQVSP